MKWSPAPSPTWPTHQAQQNTTRPFPPLASCTVAPSLLEETMDWRKSGSIRRTRTGIWTALPSSGHSCRKRKASWVTSLMLYCWQPMDMAERKSGSRMSLYVCGNYTWPLQGELYLLYTPQSVYWSWDVRLCVKKGCTKWKIIAELSSVEKRLQTRAESDVTPGVYSSRRSGSALSLSSPELETLSSPQLQLEKKEGALCNYCFSAL